MKTILKSCFIILLLIFSNDDVLTANEKECFLYKRIILADILKLKISYTFVVLKKKR